MKRSAIFSAVLIYGATVALAQSGPPSTRFSNPLLNAYSYPSGFGYRPSGFSGSVFVGGRPFFVHRFYFRPSFIHHRFFFRHPVRHRFFFRRPFIHHRIFFHHPVGRRFFFRGANVARVVSGPVSREESTHRLCPS